MDIDRLYFHMILMEVRLMNRITQLENHMSKELDDLKAAVAAEDSVIASAITLLNGLKTALDAAIASGNPADLVALSTDIGNQTAALGAAISTNTPTPPSA
jgi:ABC-type xylose transport system substrate-binding protein